MMDVVKNERRRNMNLKIEKLDYEGRGLGHWNQKVVFVPRALPMETVTIKIEKQEKNYDVGVLEKVLYKNEKRISSFCPYAKKCGGCTYDMVPYQTSLKLKKEILEDLFQKEKISIPPLEIIPSRPVLGYRNKVKFHVEGKEVGFYKEESHELIPIYYCALVNPKIMEFVNAYRPYLFSNGILEVRINYEGKLLISLETEEKLTIPEEFPAQFSIAGILWNQKCIYGHPYFEEKIQETSYLVYANSFFQVNPY